MKKPGLRYVLQQRFVVAWDRWYGEAAIYLGTQPLVIGWGLLHRSRAPPIKQEP